MGISRPGQVKSRTATKLAAEKLRALSVAADQAAAGQSSNCGKVSCQCAGGGSAAAARVSCSESEQCTASQKGDTAELGSFFGSAVDSCHGPASVGNDDGASGQSSPDDLQLPPQNVSAGQSSCGGACECDSASAHKKGGLSASSADWTLAGNFAGDGSDQLTCHPLSSAASMDRPAVSQQPLRVHGKLYESNLRQVNAHPSARRPVRADFATTW